MQRIPTLEEHQVKPCNLKIQESNHVTFCESSPLPVESQQDTSQQDFNHADINDEVLARLPQFAQNLVASPQKRVLLVEDDDTNRQLLTDYLTLYGYTLHGVGTGLEFSHALQAFRPNVILLDIRLPDVSGYTLLSQLSNHSTWSKIPVIIVSAYAFRADQVKALKLGASQYFVKPVDLQELIDAIEVELQRPQGPFNSLPSIPMNNAE